MGTAYAGVSGANGARLTFYCGEAAAARANPAIQGGPYLMAALPNDLFNGVAPTTIEVVADGKAMSIPVAAKPDGEQIEFTWKPERGFGLRQMRPVVAALRRAKRIELRAAGSAFAIPAEGAGKALAMPVLLLPLSGSRSVSSLWIAPISGGHSGSAIGFAFV